MPKSLSVDANDGIIVSFDKSRCTKFFKITLINQGKRNVKVVKVVSSLESVVVVSSPELYETIVAGRKKDYLFAAEYPGDDINEGKIRFTFLDHTHLTRTYKFVLSDSKKIDNGIDQKPIIFPVKNRTDTDIEPHTLKKERAIEITENLTIEFDETQSGGTVEVLIRNNTWNNIKLKCVSSIGKSVKLRNNTNGQIEPRGEHVLYLDAIFIPNKVSKWVCAQFIFDSPKITIERKITIHYYKSGRIFNKDDFIIPVELKALVFCNKPEVLGLLDEWVPQIENNYAEHFHALLYLDEATLRKEIKEKYNKECVQFGHVSYRRENGVDIRTPYEKGIYDLAVNELFETRPSLQIDDKVVARKCSALRVSYEGVIIELKRDDLILIQFGDNFVNDFDHSDYCVEFFFQRLTFVRQHVAIDSAVEMFGTDYLMPKEVKFREKVLLNIVPLDQKKRRREREQIQPANSQRQTKQNVQHKLYNENLNYEQKNAVIRILRGDLLLPYIIVGPPGTGKTTTLLEIILQINARIKNSKILIVTQSNSAADLITSRLIRAESFTPNDLLRLISFKYSTRDRGAPKDIEQYCHTIENLKPNVRGKNIKLTSIRNFKIVISTTNTIAHLLELHVTRNYFTHAIIDEAGQCTEVDVLIPLVLVGIGGQTIMAGDPMQMSPLVISKYANAHGLAISMLSRLRETYDNFSNKTGRERKYCKYLVTELLKNYRTIPSVLRFCNEQFYDGKLIPKVTEQRYPQLYKLLEHLDCVFTDYEKPGQYGIHFVNVNGRNEKRKASWFNVKEVKAVKFIVKKIMALGMDPEDIGVITPYALQTRALESSLQSEYAGIRVGTVEDFQGIERKVVIISTVRTASHLINIDLSRRLGFVKCPKRINVACSRASVMIVVVGKAFLLEFDDNWKALIEGCKQNHTFHEIDDSFSQFIKAESDTNYF